MSCNFFVPNLPPSSQSVSSSYHGYATHQILQNNVKPQNQPVNSDKKYQSLENICMSCRHYPHSKLPAGI